MMEVLIEQIAIYGAAAIIIIVVMWIYIRKMRKESSEVAEKITQAKEDGLHEPVSLYPVIDPNRCIKSGACIKACPEHDIIGIVNGKASVINASQCIGHGACFKACPVEAISLWIGTEKRGVDLPETDTEFQTNVPGLYIAGEIGGMGLIKNAVAQGREAVENIAKNIVKSPRAAYDLLIVGSGPAGISGALAAKKAGLKVIVLEQETLGGTVATFPRSKIIMTHPMDLPLYGKVKLYETTKTELIQLWSTVLGKNQLTITENSKVDAIEKKEDHFEVTTHEGEIYTATNVLLAIGRRGTPRKLNIPGEMSEKVAYRLLEPEDISGQRIVVVGGGDSAVEAALSLCDNNRVTLSYRGEQFTRLKKRNAALIHQAMDDNKLDIKFNSHLTAIEPDKVWYTDQQNSTPVSIENDRVFIFAGGELPTQFLKKSGIHVITKHGEAVLKHD